MRPQFVVSVLVLESDAEAYSFFHGKSTRDLKTLAGGKVPFFVPDTIEDAFSPAGVQRYPDLERRDLSCLWVEDQNAHFKIDLKDKTVRQIRDVLSDLGDAARGAANVQAWRAEFERRQAMRTPAGGGSAVNQGGNQAGQGGGGGQPPQGDAGVLVQLGRIAGIAGIGLGAFFMLFAKFVFPQLDPKQANLFMLLCYGIALLALVSSAAATPKGRQTALLLAAVGLALALLGVFALGPSGPNDYTVAVTVRSPSNSLVQEAQISCSTQCTVKQGSGAWDVTIPREYAKANSKVTISAAVPARGWQADSSVDLSSGSVHTVTLHLEERGELPVRGVVVDSAGNGIPNARVGRYGEPPVTTDADGGFALNTHAAKGAKVKLRAAKEPYLPADVEYTVGSDDLKITLQAQTQPPAPQPKTSKTGDRVIDDVLANLAALKRNGRTPSESDLSNALAPLFSRPSFYHGIREEDWRYFLYTLCRTRLLLEEYVDQFKAHPQVRQHISLAIQRMVALQNTIAGLYGPTFSVTQHIDRYIGTKAAFIEHLPAIVTEPTADYFDQRDHEIRAIRDLMRNAGFPVG